MPAHTNRSLTKHHTAITHRLTTIPAVLPATKIDSQSTSKIQIRKRETSGAYLEPISHIKNAASVKAPAVTASHNKCAGPQDSIAKGAKKMNAVGMFTYKITAWRAATVSDLRSPPSSR